MTAMNIFVQPGAAYLLSDTAAYDETGLITHFQHKVTEITTAFGEPVAIATTGVLSSHDLMAPLNKLRPSTLTAVIEALPGILHELERGLRDRFPNWANPFDMGLVMAAVDMKGEARGFALANGDDNCFGNGYCAYRVMELNSHISGCKNTAFNRPVDYCDPSSFDPVRDGRTLIEAQRRDPFPTPDGKAHVCAIGGQAVLTKLTTAGIERVSLVNWADRAGEFIQPAALIDAQGIVVSKVPSWPHRGGADTQPLAVAA